MLPKHSVVAFMQGDTVVIDHPCRIDGTLQIPIALVRIKFELVGFHAFYDGRLPLHLYKQIPYLNSKEVKQNNYRVTVVALRSVVTQSANSLLA